MDRTQTEGVLQVDFSDDGAPALLPNHADNLIEFGVLHRTMLRRNTIADSVAGRRR